MVLKDGDRIINTILVTVARIIDMERAMCGQLPHL